MIGLGICLVLVGLALVVYFVLFMSWSHSFGSPDFQRKQDLVLWFAGITIVVGIALMVAAWRRRKAKSSDERRASEQQL